jgi:hypothetical protein
VKIVMKMVIGGTRDGDTWPAVGETMVVPDEEGASLCALGYADPVGSAPAAEKTAAKRAEKR